MSKHKDGRNSDKHKAKKKQFLKRVMTGIGTVATVTVAVVVFVLTGEKR